MRSARHCITSGVSGRRRAALETARGKKPPEVAELVEARKKIAQLERALGRKTYELELAGEALRGRK